jgi:hypothetical protein
MLPTVTVLGVIGVVAGVAIILGALLAPARSRRMGNSDVRQGYAGDSQRFDVRFGVVLLIAGATLTTPHLFGLEYQPVTLAVLGFFLLVLVIGYSRYAKQMSAPQPLRYTEPVAAAPDFQSRVTSPNFRA